MRIVKRKKRDNEWRVEHSMKNKKGEKKETKQSSQELFFRRMLKHFSEFDATFLEGS